MKRGTKMTVFFASMALTVGSLVAFIGPRQCGHGMYGHGGWASHQQQGGNCMQEHSADSATTK